jgi:group II intron reverse transcriptase/maturase
LCADAIEQCFKTLCHQNPSWVLEGDIKGCFDNISHQWLLDNVPLNKAILRKWLKSGYLEKQVFFDTISGTPQGGIISPVLANLALDGLERRLRESFPLRGKGSERGRAAQVHLIRYADDFVITGHSEELLKVMTVKPLVESFLLQRGLVLSPEKTVITHVRDGFDFLGQNVRRYPNGKLFIKPSRKSIETLLSKVKQIIREHIGRAAHILIKRLNPVIRGWANYHRHVVSKRIFARLDAAIFRMLWQWAQARHPRKGCRWIKQKYFERVGTRDWWFFGKPDGTDGWLYRVRLFHASSVKIVRHVQVRSGLNPYDPSWNHTLPGVPSSLHTARVHDLSVREGLSRVSWKLSSTVLRGGTNGNVGSLLGQKAGKSKQPYCFEMMQREPFAFAGLWERWRGSDGTTLETCTILTTTPNQLLADVHDRMPVILPPASYDCGLIRDFETWQRQPRCSSPTTHGQMRRYPSARGSIRH